MTFNAKNLTYESNEPAFLRKLKGQYGDTASARHQQRSARPRKQRNSAEEDEDEPLYLHGANPHEPLSKAEYDALTGDTATADCDEVFTTAEELSGSAGKASKQTEPSFELQGEGDAKQGAPSKQQMAVIGATSKKRSARIIEDGAAADAAQGSAEKLEPAKSQRSKKTKRQKLSFQDD
ncbi:MAG: hypothetical protein Q9216_000276 [Gyalolechia sp. 2 TL-2023]